MPMSTSKKTDRLESSSVNIYDKGNRKLIGTYAILVLFFLHAVLFPTSIDYLAEIQEGGKYGIEDKLYDYFIPLLAALIIFYAFFNDYQDGVYKILAFYSNRTYNFQLLRRFLRYMIPLGLGSFLAGIIQYRNVSFLDMDSFFLSLRFVPNLVFLSALVICITVYSKNSYTGLFAALTYVLVDYLSASRIFDAFSIGAHANNFFYTFSPAYYYMNRWLILFLGFFLLFLAGKRAAKL